MFRRIQGFGEETKGKESLGRPRCIWEDNIKNKSSRGVMGRHQLDFFGLGYGQVSGTYE